MYRIQVFAPLHADYPILLQDLLIKLRVSWDQCYDRDAGVPTDFSTAQLSHNKRRTIFSLCLVWNFAMKNWKEKREKIMLLSCSDIWIWEQMHAKSHPQAQAKANICSYEEVFMKQKCFVEIWVEWSSREFVPAYKVHLFKREKDFSWEKWIY